VLRGESCTMNDGCDVSCQHEAYQSTVQHAAIRTPSSRTTADTNRGALFALFTKHLTNRTVTLTRRPTTKLHKLLNSD